MIDPADIAIPIEPAALALLTKSQTAARLGIVNDPRRLAEPERSRVLAALAGLWHQILVPTIERWPGLQISSGYRCPELNLAIRGARASQHMRGEAADIECPGVANRVLADWIVETLPFDQLVLEFARDDDPAAGWVHVSYVSNGRREYLTFDGRRYTSAAA